jgi:hypothetical protein
MRAHGPLDFGASSTAPIGAPGPSGLDLGERLFYSLPISLLARISTSTMPEPGVSPYAPTRISRAALLIARTMNAAQSSSAAKQTAMATSETGRAGQCGRVFAGRPRGLPDWPFLGRDYTPCSAPSGTLFVETMTRLLSI